MDGVLHAVDEERPVTAHVEQALDPVEVTAAGVEEHREPDAEGGPVDDAVELEDDSSDLAVVVVCRPCDGRELAQRPPADPKEQLGVDVAERGPEHGRRGVERGELSLERVERRGVGEIRLREDEHVGRCRLLHALRAAEPMLAVDGRHDAVELVVVRHERVGEERVHDRGRVGDPRRLDDDTPKGRDLACIRAVEQVAQLVGQIAAQRAAHAAAGEQHGALVDAAQEVMVEPDLAQLVDDHRGLRELGAAQQRSEQRRLAAAEEPRDEGDRPLHEASDASSAGSSGSSGRPARRSASTHSAWRSPTSAVPPFRSRST